MFSHLGDSRTPMALTWILYPVSVSHILSFTTTPSKLILGSNYYVLF